MENQVVEKIIEVLKTQLEPSNCKDIKSEIFLSKDDLKFSFAQAIISAYPEAKVILEYPIMTKDFYNEIPFSSNEYFGKEKYYNDRTYIDVYFNLNGEEYFIELKYKTLSLGCSRYVEDKTFCLKNQTAGNLHAIYEDIERMEQIKNYKLDWLLIIK